MNIRSILIVEDEKEIREILQEALEYEGYRTRAASNGLEAIDALDRDHYHPDVILLDLMMPVMDGWEFLERKKQNHSSIPVVVVSAVAEMGKKVRAHAFLRKPIELDALLETIERCIT